MSAAFVEVRAAGFVVRRELRRRAVAYVGLVVLVGIGGGAAVGALVVADRTDRVYPGYVRSAAVQGLTVNPSLATAAMDREMHHLPGVHAVHTDWLLAATVSVVGPA